MTSAIGLVAQRPAALPRRVREIVLPVQFVRQFIVAIGAVKSPEFGDRACPDSSFLLTSFRYHLPI